MLKRFVEVLPRSFDPSSVSGLSNKARAAVNESFDAMSTWRQEAADSGEKVIKKMAVAAAALGWPEQIVDAARVQMQNIVEMQVKAMDQMMDAWEDQLKQPKQMTASHSTMSELNTLPNFGSAASWPGANETLQFWTQFAGQWQKSCADAIAFWTNASKPHQR